MSMTIIPLGGNPFANLDLIPTRYILFNGPAGSGKDAMCMWLAETADAVLHVKLSGILKMVIGDALGYTYDELEANKNKISAKGKTPRQHQIDLFWYLEEQFGPAVLADIFLTHRRQSYMRDIVDMGGVIPTYVISDTGRQPEFERLIEGLKPDNILLIRLHRPDFTFEGDIREYVYDERVVSHDVENDGTLDDLRAKVKTILDPWSHEWANRVQARMTELGVDRG